MENSQIVDLIVLISDNQIDFYNKKGDRLNHLDFEDKVFKDLKAENKQTFVNKTVDFIQNLNVREKTIICLLSDDLVIKKVIERKESESEIDHKDHLDGIDLPESQLIFNKLKTEDEVHLFITSLDIVHLVKSAFESASWTVKAILPASMYYKSAKVDHLSDKILHAMLDDRELIEMGNLSTKLPQKLPPIKSKTAKSKSAMTKHRSPFLFTVLMIVLDTAIIGYLYYLVTYPPLPTYILDNSSINSQTNPQPTSSPQVTISPIQPTPTVNKSDLKLRVLNGSGVSGQASEVKNSLSQIGFRNIEVGNAGDYQSDTTEVIFSSKVPQSIQTEVINKLKGSFDKVESEIETTPQYDIQITTGTD